MDEKTKNIIVYSVMAIIITLFLVSIFVGKTMPKDASNDVSTENGALEQNNQTVREYNELTEEASGTAIESNIIQENHEQQEIDTPDPDTLKEPESFYRKHFSGEQIKESRKVAKQFATNYYAFNGDKPIQHIKNAHAYMTDKMYQKLVEKTPRPTAAIYKKQIVSAKVYEPYEPSEEYFVWKARVTGDIYNSKGKKTRQEVVNYTLKMKQIEETFRVRNYKLNVLHH
ncbi:hypothetical protein [Lentibacillus cibarius]|uniref:Uncharacterized protein n=1 Tax=Lentibacillus cibarius TaxID=2583219 RepID=A0A5S3QGK0_9BACI|nr:hypothetical protein [Lentibacillus cibarius]TMN20937.1 hypothetical protein FFL34_01545 [Lentibacillus cibarius]